VKFTVTDVFGQSVFGSFAAWSHVEKRHVEMTGREDQVKAAIEKPLSVHEGNKANRLVYRGQQIASGFWRNAHVIAVVEYRRNKDGYLDTAYMDTLEPPGAVKWPKS
jgi:hypothetical protein